MAIQVNGTQVIGNSRELTNIASVDATTAAAIGAAGVGGGSNTFTAAQTISAGVPVGLNSSGQLIPAAGAETTVVSDNQDIASIDQMMSVWYADEGVFVTAFSYVSGNKLVAYKAAGDGIGSITVGSHLYVNNNRAGVALSYDTVNDRVLFSRCNGQSSNAITHQTISSIDSTTLAITLNSAASYNSGRGNTEMNSIFVAPQSRHLVTYYDGDNNMKIDVISTASSTPSGQAELGVNTSSLNGKPKLCNLSGSQFLAMWAQGQNQYFYCAVGSLSGSTITLGSHQLVDSGPGPGWLQTTEGAIDPVSGKLVLTWTSESNNYET